MNDVYKSRGLDGYVIGTIVELFERGKKFPTRIVPGVLVLLVSLLLVDVRAQTGGPQTFLKTPHVLINDGQVRVSIGKDVLIPKGTEVTGIVVIAGDVKVEGRVEGDVVVVGGKAEILGHVTGSVVSSLGSAQLGDEAKIDQDVVVVGGEFQEGANSFVGGQKNWIALGNTVPNFKGAFQWIASGPMKGRWLPLGFVWPWVVAGVSVLLYVFLAIVLAKPANHCTNALSQQPLASFLSGVLIIILTGPLLMLLLVSVVGIIVIPFVICAGVAALLFGKMVTLRFVGEQLGRQLGGGLFTQPLIGLLLGCLLVLVLYTIPILGFLTWGLLTPLGLGAVFMASIQGSKKREDPIMSAPRDYAAGPGSAPSSEVTLDLPPTPAFSQSVGSDALLLPRVGFWRRFSASFLDLILIAVLSALAGQPVIFLVLLLMYHVGMLGWKGTTIGGTILGIKCFRTNGSSMDYGSAAIRAVSAVFSILVAGIGYFWAGWDSEKQAWHDKIAGTIVVKMPKGAALL